MSKKYHPDLCKPLVPNQKWLDYIKSTYYVNKKGEVYKKRNGLKPIGSENQDGYLTVCFTKFGEKKNLKIHHVCFYLYHGYWSELELHHVNGDRKDNSVFNLEQVTREENLNHRYEKSHYYTEYVKDNIN